MAKKYFFRITSISIVAFILGLSNLFIYFGMLRYSDNCYASAILSPELLLIPLGIGLLFRIDIVRKIAILIFSYTVLIFLPDIISRMWSTIIYISNMGFNAYISDLGFGYLVFSFIFYIIIPLLLIHNLTLPKIKKVFIEKGNKRPSVFAFIIVFCEILITAWAFAITRGGNFGKLEDIDTYKTRFEIKNEELFKQVIDCRTLEFRSGKIVSQLGIKCKEGERGKEAIEFVKKMIKPGQRILLDLELMSKEKNQNNLATIYVFVCDDLKNYEDSCDTYVPCDSDLPSEYQVYNLGGGKLYIDLGETLIKEGYADRTDENIPDDLLDDLHEARMIGKKPKEIPKKSPMENFLSYFP